MKPRLAINGFGRIGRLIFRTWLETPNPDYDIVALNAISNPETALHLLRYDSVHGRLNATVQLENNCFNTPHGKVALLNQRDLATIDWRDVKADIILECSGKFNNKASAEQHITVGGAKKVLVSAPCKQADITVVYGVNHEKLTANHQVISNASCTTNCVAPLAKIMHQIAEIKQGYMTTIHAYTSDQNIIDAQHKDLRRARAAAVSMIPAKTGAARAVGEVIPELAGKLDGSAMRVPTPNVSFLDLSFTAGRNVTIDEIHQAVITASRNEMHGILDYCDEPLVSTDFNHHPASCIFDLSQTQIIDGNFLRVGAWYDNEWGFSLRMVDMARLIAKQL